MLSSLLIPLRQSLARNCQVLSPDQNCEWLVRVRLIRVDESRSSSAVGSVLNTRDDPAHGRVFSDVIRFAWSAVRLAAKRLCCSFGSFWQAYLLDAMRLEELFYQALLSFLLLSPRRIRSDLDNGICYFGPYRGRQGTDLLHWDLFSECRLISRHV